MYALALLHRGQKLTNSPGSSLSDDPGDLPVNRLDFVDSARSRMLDLPRTENRPLINDKPVQPVEIISWFWWFEPYLDCIFWRKKQNRKGEDI